MKKNIESTRQFAEQVVRTLRTAGYEALFAGGCVRDKLLNIPATDYDVATNARPEEVRQIFGKHRTLAIGAAFGVITILGPVEAGPIEVATFRCDGAYVDGRRPTEVIFSTAQQDAQRRDFTLNGLFYDPLTDTILDFVEGQQDLKNRVLRAIGNAEHRFQEDKLRLLRAIRFAARFELQIDAATWEAISRMAAEIHVVSVERIAAEMRRMMVSQQRSLALTLLRNSGLLTALLPEYDATPAMQEPVLWEELLNQLQALHEPVFPTALAVVLRPICHAAQLQAGTPLASTAGVLCRRWKLSNEETEIVQWLLLHEATIATACEQPWSHLQPVLVAPHIEALLQYVQAVRVGNEASMAAVAYCRNKLQLPEAELNPPLLLTGNELQRQGFQPGPKFKQILIRLRAAQLEGQVATAAEALTLAHTLYKTL